MKQAWLYVCGLMFLGMIIMLGANPAGAASAAGPYYATPSWDQTLPASTRFIVLTNMNSEAVLDRETGLVWEQSPSTETSNWPSAQIDCNQLTKGNRKGWRLPTIQELASLIEPGVVYPGPALPAGHPFSNVQSTYYWSATSFIYIDESGAWVVDFSTGKLGGGVATSTTWNFWCVRGGQGVNPQ